MSRDIVVMIPIDGKFKYDKFINNSYNDKYIEILKNVSNYECDKLISSSIERYSIGELELSYMSDEYDLSTAKYIKCNAILAYQSSTNLGILQLILTNFNDEMTPIGDIFSSENAYFRINDEVISLEQYLKTELHVKQCSKARCIYVMPKSEYDVTEGMYLLASEELHSNHKLYKIKNKEVYDLATTNLASYDFYDLYASIGAVIYALEVFPTNINERIEVEALLIFICEIALLQNAAISRINKRIVAETIDDSDISPSKALKLQVEFGHTIILWDNKIYKYYLAQLVSDKIIKAFKNDELYEEYLKNKRHVEHVSNLKSSIANEREGKILNVVAFVLSITELISLFLSFMDIIPTIHPSIYISISATTVLFILFICIRNYRRNKSKNKYY